MAEYLLDTNVVSELRKGSRAHRSVLSWYDGLNDEGVYLSVLVVGELSRGIERIRRRDEVAARRLAAWLEGVVGTFVERILPVTEPIARVWGGYGVPNSVPTVDGLLAATAQHHGLILATRNVRDVVATGVPLVNPFAPPP